MDQDDDTLDIALSPSDHLFHKPERICVFGSSGGGKTHLTVNLVRRFSDRFYKIILCGNKNDLLTLPETRAKTEMYQSDSQGEEIFNPFQHMDPYDMKKNDTGRQLLLVYDDLMETVYKSPIISQIFSKGRHLGLSVILILQTYYPTGSGTSLMPQIKNNATIQIFTKCRSQSEIGSIASRLEYGKHDREFFVNLFKKLVLDKRYGYVAVFMDSSDSRVRYANNLIGEDGSPYLTVYIRRKN